MSQRRSITPSEGLSTVRYRDPWPAGAARLEMERLGYEIISAQYRQSRRVRLSHAGDDARSR